MSQFVKKQHLCVSIGSYTNSAGQLKQSYKQIGELLTFDDNGQLYQFFRLWGPHGVTEGKIFDLREDEAQSTATPTQTTTTPAPQAQTAQDDAFDDDMPF